MFSLKAIFWQVKNEKILQRNNVYFLGKDSYPEKKLHFTISKVNFYVLCKIIFADKNNLKIFLKK